MREFEVRTKSFALLVSRAVHGPIRRLAAILTVAAVAAVGVSALPASGAEPSGRAAELRRADDVLAARSRSAVLELYALQSQVRAAEGRAAEVRARADAVARERAAVARQLRIARVSLGVAQAGLADRLRALYEQGGTDPLTIILGSESLEDALAAIDGLGFAAQQDRTLVARTREARSTLARLAERLDGRASELARLGRQADAHATALAARESERERYVASLAREQRLNADQLAALQRQVAEAQARTTRFESRPVATASTAAAGTAILDAVPAAPTPAEPTSGAAATTATPAGRTLVVSATGYAIRGRTATGLPTGWGVAAVDPSVIPLGTRFSVPGYGEAVAADVGSAVRGNEIDLWFPSHAKALAWGRRTVTIIVR
jgi:3D (Asp-Asp-Asp) domain-containing protein